MKVKICGLTHREDVLLADESGADYLGFIMSTGFRRSVTDRAAELGDGTRASRVAVLVDEDVPSAAHAGRELGASVLQLHGAETVETIQGLRDLGSWGIWKAVRARQLSDVTEAVERYGDFVDALLLEGFREGVVGGAGVRMTIPAEELGAALPGDLPWVLAGGLDPDNVADAVALYRPDVVDVSSGLERERGRKDPALMTDFVQRSRRAFERAGNQPPGDHPS